tara:strand:- start:1126 stop:1476 length:351 start_codon:yes stop_codon:yes gene_type:complete
MKRSELKEYIRGQIIEILTEESAEEIKAKTAAQAELNKELEKTKELIGEEEEEEEGEDVSLDVEKESIQDIMTQMSNLFDNYKKGKIELKDYIPMRKSLQAKLNKIEVDLVDVDDE